MQFFVFGRKDTSKSLKQAFQRRLSIPFDINNKLFFEEKMFSLRKVLKWNKYRLRKGRKRETATRQRSSEKNALISVNFMGFFKLRRDVYLQ